MYKLPIPIRKWFINRINQREEKKANKNGDNPNVPLTDAQKKKMIQQAESVNNSPSKVHTMFQSAKKQ